MNMTSVFFDNSNKGRSSAVSEQKPFVIERVSWHTKRPGNPNPPEYFYRWYWTVAEFLQRHDLTVRELAASPTAITDDFEIRSDDLTAEGLQFMRTGFQKWLRMLDRGGDPGDSRILEKELAKLRNG